MKRNESEEFATFVRETATALHRAALLLTGDHHQAEDLTQATYVRVLAAWRRTAAAESPFAYARTTMLNTFLSQRRLRRSSEAPVADLAVDSPVADGDPDTRVDLLAALSSLPPLDRAVVVLRYWEDRSVADTAVDLGMTEVNVRARARRALQRLRPLLASADLTERTH